MKIISPTNKLGRNEFRCFHCRKVNVSKNGEWVHWKDMEVHLCVPCDQLTVEWPERGGKKPPAKK